MWAGAMHWVKGAKPRLALSQSESQDRWQSQRRLLECSRLREMEKEMCVSETKKKNISYNLEREKPFKKCVWIISVKANVLYQLALIWW